LESHAERPIVVAGVNQIRFRYMFRSYVLTDWFRTPELGLRKDKPLRADLGIEQVMTRWMIEEPTPLLGFLMRGRPDGWPSHEARRRFDRLMKELDRGIGDYRLWYWDEPLYAPLKPGIIPSIRDLLPDVFPDEPIPEDETWIELHVVSPRGEAFENLDLDVRLPDRTALKAKTDGRARWRIDSIEDPGSCWVKVAAPLGDAGSVVIPQLTAHQLIEPAGPAVTLRTGKSHVLVIPDPLPFIGARIYDLGDEDQEEGRGTLDPDDPDQNPEFVAELAVLARGRQFAGGCDLEGIAVEPVAGRTARLEFTKVRDPETFEGQALAAPVLESETGRAYLRDGEVLVEARLQPDGTVIVPEVPLGHHYAVGVYTPRGPLPVFGEALGGIGISRLGEKFTQHGGSGSSGAAIAFPLKAPRPGGLAPAFALAYHTEGCNGPYGFGWRDTLPFFQRSTARAQIRETGRGMPQYNDELEGDVYIFGDAEDLVQDGGSKGGGVLYRPRIERGPRSRIERLAGDAGLYWRVTTPGNVVSIFGKSPEACIVDPADPKRIFKWLLEEQSDAYGNVVVYRYKQEDLVGVDLGHPVEAGRTAETEPQRYLKRILYNNRIPVDQGLDRENAEHFMFEVVLDYGEHANGDDATPEAVAPWQVRKDAFSYRRSGFDIRTRRLCRRVLVFQRMAADEQRTSFPPTLVDAVELSHESSGSATLLNGATRIGYDLTAKKTRSAKLPKQTFEFSPRVVQKTFRTSPTSSLAGYDLSPDPKQRAIEIFDLDGRGIASLVIRNLSGFSVLNGRGFGLFEDPVKLEMGVVPTADTGICVQQFLPIAGQGRPTLLEFGKTSITHFERDPNSDEWMGGKVLNAGVIQAGDKTIPTTPPPPIVQPKHSKKRAYVTDLDGDGLPDLLIAEATKYEVWRSYGAQGWKQLEADPKYPFEHATEDDGPAPVLSDREAVTFFADLTGDGLPDAICVRPGEVVYWPNLGYGKFGPKVVLPVALSGPPERDRIRFFDLDGLGSWGLVYFGTSGAQVFLNEAGNRLVLATTVAMPDPFKKGAELDLATVACIDGRATASIMWGKGKDDLQIVDLFSAVRPFLLTESTNGRGLTTRITYAPSMKFFLADDVPGPVDTSWVTRLPYAIAVAEKVEVHDAITGRRFTSTFSYHHGYYDPIEREFRGFGRIEQLDSENFETFKEATQGSDRQIVEEKHFSPPKRTKTWFHTGWASPNGEVTRAFEGEYSLYDNKRALLPEITLPAKQASVAERGEAMRALKGCVLRTEVYAEDGSDAATRPIVITEHGYAVTTVVRKSSNHHGSFFCEASNVITYTYEREEVPDPRAVQVATLGIDDYGCSLGTVTVAYPRRVPDPEPLPPPVPDDPLDPVPPTPEPQASFCARLVGLHFDQAKNFIRPEMRHGLRTLAGLYAEHPGFSLVLVGHTDRYDSRADNDVVSLERAQAVAAFLRDDVEAWLARYRDDVHRLKRWGDVEDDMMLGARGYSRADLPTFQLEHGLPPHGELDTNTRRALIAAYMAMDGTSLPKGTAMYVVGAGEYFPLIPTAENVKEPANRRAELFFFADGVEPVPTASHLDADSTEYVQWLGAAKETINIAAETGEVLGRSGSSPRAGSQPPMLGSLPPELLPGDVIVRRPMGAPQHETVITVEQLTLVHQDEVTLHRIGTVVERKLLRAQGEGDSSSPFLVEALRGIAGAATELLGHTIQRFYAGQGHAKDIAASIGEVGPYALPYATYTRAFASGQVEALWQKHLKNLSVVLLEGGYTKEPDGANWWVPSGRSVHDPSAFFLPIEAVDGFDDTIAFTTYDEDHHLPVETRDVHGNTTKTEYNRRVLAPSKVQDPNGRITETKYDPLGQPVLVSTYGADGPDDGKEVRETKQRKRKKDGDKARDLDDEKDKEPATFSYAYNVLAFEQGGAPVSETKSIRLRHGVQHTDVRIGVTYYDGSGAVVQTLASESKSKWRASGRTVVDNRGLPVETFEPFLTGSGAFARTGGELAARFFYDALGRRVQTVFRDGTMEKVEHNAWQMRTFDRNDTVDESDWVTTSKPNIRALSASEEHAETPTTLKLDVLGRTWATVAILRELHPVTNLPVDTVLPTRSVFDVVGNVLEVVDARGHVAEKREYGLIQNALRVRSADAGDTYTLLAIDGQPLRHRNALGQIHRVTYDILRRPVDTLVRHTNGREVLLARRVYLDEQDLVEGLGSPTNASDPPAPKPLPHAVQRSAGHDLTDLDDRTVYHRSRLFRIYDGAGETTFEKYDFKGNPTKVVRRFTKKAESPDWSFLGHDTTPAKMRDAAKGLLDDTPFITLAEYDAESRPIETRSATGVWQRLIYNEAGVLQRVDWQRVAPRKTPPPKVEPVDDAKKPTPDTGKQVDEQFEEPTEGAYKLAYVVDDYDHLGRPTQVRHGNVATTTYTYDPLSNRLSRLTTKRKNGGLLRDLHHTYDAAGNILSIVDEAQATVHFDNAAVEATNTYGYDSLYRLISATGREHIGQAANAANYDLETLRTVSPQDPTALRNYTQTYRYDAAGNIVRMRHQTGSKTSAASWTRDYVYSSFGNRLRATGKSTAEAHELYDYDAMGNMVAMPHLDLLVWDEVGQLVSTKRGTQSVQMQYDGGGARVRKLTQNGASRTEERLYLGASERFQKRDGSGKVLEETITEHIGGGLVLEFKTRKDGRAFDGKLTRHQIGNHLGSITMELDEDGKVISFEEYHPYGTSAYRACDASVEVSPNRYRYTGMERDEETGLSHHGARYYAPWLGRWSAADPIGLDGGINRYRYCSGDPISFNDTRGTSERLVTEQYTYAYEAPLGPSMYEFEDEEVKGLSKADLFMNDLQPSLLAQRADPKLEARREAQRVRQIALDNYLLHEGGLERRINKTRNMGATVMGIYAASLVLLPFAIEGGIIFADTLLASGLGNNAVGWAAFNATEQLGGAVTTYLAGDSFLAGSFVLATGAAEAYDLSTGGPGPDVPPLQLLTSKRGGDAPFDPAKLAKIRANLEAEGAVFNMGREATLRKWGAGAAYLRRPGKPGIFYFSSRPTEAEVVEELFHLGQHRRAGWKIYSHPSSIRIPLVQDEIVAQHALLKIGRRLGWSESALSSIRGALKEWYNELTNLLGR